MALKQAILTAYFPHLHLRVNGTVVKCLHSAISFLTYEPFGGICTVNQQDQNGSCWLWAWTHFLGLDRLAGTQGNKQFKQLNRYRLWCCLESLQLPCGTKGSEANAWRKKAESVCVMSRISHFDCLSLGLSYVAKLEILFHETPQGTIPVRSLDPTVFFIILKALQSKHFI